MDSQWQVKRSVYNTGPGKEKTEGLEIQEPVKEKGSVCKVTTQDADNSIRSGQAIGICPVLDFASLVFTGPELDSL